MTHAAQPARTQVSIRMGDMLVGCGPQSMRTLLGSCIGLVLHGRGGPGGLAHMVLPESLGLQAPPAKYVDTAIPELLRRIELAGGQASNVTAKVAGGANMFATQAVSTIGDKNLATVRQLLQELKIPIVAEHCGGVQGRQMTYYPDTGRVTIEVVGGDRVDI